MLAKLLSSIFNKYYHIRSHCNVDPSIGTKHIEITKEAFSRYEQYITHEIVAFPQHGLLRSQVEPLMREALRMGATHVGGVDPALVDRHVDHSIAKIFELATTFNKKLMFIYTPVILWDFMNLINLLIIQNKQRCLEKSL